MAFSATDRATRRETSRKMELSDMAQRSRRRLCKAPPAAEDELLNEVSFKCSWDIDEETMPRVGKQTSADVKELHRSQRVL